jgi:hypothetical protein
MSAFAQELEYTIRRLQEGRKQTLKNAVSKVVDMSKHSHVGYAPEHVSLLGKKGRM